MRSFQIATYTFSMQLPIHWAIRSSELKFRRPPFREALPVPEITSERPGHPAYFMGIALAVRERADCRGQKVGAVIVVEQRIVSTGYNGTPTKMKNCSDGGCYRCANRDKT